MSIAYKNARLCYNNWVDSATLQTSASVSNFPSSNLLSGIRSKVWKAKGTFEISAANQKVYINATSYNIPIGSYDVTSLITAFNTATGQTLSRNSLGRFVITLGSSGTVNFTSNTSAIWDTLGFFRVADETGTIFTADERRYNNGEWIKVDLGFPQSLDFSSIIAPSGEIFSASTAEIRLQGNNVDEWTSPQVNELMEVSGAGAFIAPQTTLTTCRYWRIRIKDYKNPSISVAVAYMGTGFITINTNIATGFNRVRSDQSLRLYSEGGQLYVDRRPKILSLTSMQVQFLEGDELKDTEQLVEDLGIGTPFFICLDPSKSVSSSLSQMTHYVELDGDVTFSHVIGSYYNLAFQLREVL